MTMPLNPLARVFTAVAPSRAVALAILVLAAACGSSGDTGPDSEILLTVETTRLSELPVVGTPITVDVGTWNLEWFGDAGNGPADEELQLANVGYLMEGLGIDLWAVQEVTSVSQFDSLVARMEGFAGFLANDPTVVDGARYYSDFNDTEQKIGIVYRSDLVSVDSARVVLGDHDYDFAGRPPLQVHASVAGESGPSELIVVVLHAKAGSESEDRARRRDGAQALREYLDAAYPDRRVLVTGDFNDDIDTSIATGESPYATFVDDPGYRFVTAPLSEAGASSTIFFSDMVDHQLVTDELAAMYVDGSAAVVPANDYIVGYAETTSDHLPVTARYGTEVVPMAAGPMARGLLRWSGATTDRVDVYRMDVLVASTPNDGRYLDELSIAAGTTVEYRVCEAGSQVCSSPVPATF